MVIEINEISPFENEEDLEMADGLSGAVGADLTTYLNLYVKENGLGTVFNADTDFVLGDIGKRRPDIAFCSFETLPEPPRTVVPVPPDLAIEVVSSRDEFDNTDRKLQEYLQVKIKLIWVVRPVMKVIEVYRQDGTTTLLNLKDTLKGEDVVKGFELPISKLFGVAKRPD